MITITIDQQINKIGTILGCIQGLDIEEGDSMAGHYKCVADLIEIQGYLKTTVVRKLVSLSPEEYEYIPRELALKRYVEYIRECADVASIDTKDFAKWCATEI